MSSLDSVNSINITSGPTISNFLPVSTRLFSAQVSVNGADYQAALDNIQESAVPTAIDTLVLNGTGRGSQSQGLTTR